jgi:hypothetical protein
MQEMAGLLLDPAYPELSAWGDAAAERAEAEAAAAAVAAAAAAAATSAAGDLSHAAPPGVAPRDLVVEPAAAQFYAQAGAAAAALGVAVDIFAACPRWMGGVGVGARVCVCVCAGCVSVCVGLQGRRGALPRLQGPV